MTARPIVKQEKHVLALYYLWYGTPQGSGSWIHQDQVNVKEKFIGTHAHYPQSGPYDSADPTIIDLHLKQAKSAGIDTLVCSWWGAKDPTDKAFRTLLAHAPQFGMKVCILWERLSRDRNPGAAMADLAYMLKTYSKEPGYFHADGKPVFFIYTTLCQSLSQQNWVSVLEATSEQFPPGLTVIGTGAAQEDTLLWDGWFSLNGTLAMPGQTIESDMQIQHRLFHVPLQLTHLAGRISVESVAPGFDDRRYTSITGGKGGIQVDRQDGKLYSALWKQVLDDNPDWILINSFNQWHIGTEIEPSVELGDKYLLLTHDLSAQFKQTTP